MFDLTEEFIKQCSLSIAQYDTDSIHLIITNFHKQKFSSQKNLKEKFQRLIPNENTRLIKTQLAVINHFKQKYLSELHVDSNKQAFSIENELNLAYSFLLAYLDDRHMLELVLDNLKFVLSIKTRPQSLFDLYTKIGLNLEQFFLQLVQCDALEALVCNNIQDFQEFIVKYKDFLSAFETYYQQLPTNEDTISTDTLVNLNGIHSFILSDQIPNHQSQNENLPRVIDQQLSLLNVPKKALCVIINISPLDSSQSIEKSRRKGSEKDVDAIINVFKKLKFTILCSKCNFTKSNIDQAINIINDKEEFEHFDCLVIFIMSHGFLHTFLTRDREEEVVIRDFVKYFDDSSTTTIWKGKPRLFFIQACRSLRPASNPLYKNSNQMELQMNELSPEMLVAYSCGPSGTADREINRGAIYIQQLCTNLLQYGHCMPIQRILNITADHLVTFQKIIRRETIQKPEFIQRYFDPNFRFSSHCLLKNYPIWSNTDQIRLDFPLGRSQAISNLYEENMKLNSQ